MVVDQLALLIVSNTLSNHTNDQLETMLTLDAINPRVGKAKRAAFDAGYFSETNIERFQSRQVEPFIATGRQPHHSYLHSLLAQLTEPLGEDATLQLKMKYKLQSEEGKAFYRLRKRTVEPVFGIIKESMGFRQFSLRGLTKSTGEWNLVCLAFNFRHLYQLMLKKVISPTSCLARRLARRGAYTINH
ncbi:transposase [Tumidithrix helvetica]|uniref:transposase n=1 Tax=Tumidithrix helvetica TaxID=3457545 RepID=UPI003CC5B727